MLSNRIKKMHYSSGFIKQAFQSTKDVHAGELEYICMCKNNYVHKQITVVSRIFSKVKVLTLLYP